MQRLSENRFAGENHFPGNCTGENSRATITVNVVIARGHGLTFTSKRRSRGLRCRKEGGSWSVIKAIFAGTLEEHGNTYGGNWDGVAEGSARSLRRIKPERLSLRWRGPDVQQWQRLTQRAAATDHPWILKSRTARFILSSFSGGHPRPPFSLSPFRIFLSLVAWAWTDTARGCGGSFRLLSSALVKTIASTWRFRVIDSRGIVVSFVAR